MQQINIANTNLISLMRNIPHTRWITVRAAIHYFCRPTHNRLSAKSTQMGKYAAKSINQHKSLTSFNGDSYMRYQQVLTDFT